MSKISKYEQETIINYNNEENTASVYTHDKNLINKIEKHMSKFSDITQVWKDIECAEYTIPKKWVKVVFPRQLSDKQRAEMADRAKNARAAINKKKDEG